MKTPHFTLRDLFWLMLVCALGCAWWLERSRNYHPEDWKTAGGGISHVPAVL